MIKDDLKSASGKILRVFWCVIASIAFLQICAYVNTYGQEMITELRLFKYEVVGSIFGAVIIAPLIEEFTKRLAMKGGYLYLYAVIFGFGEMYFYHLMGTDWIVRMPVVFVHLFLASVHWNFEVKSKADGGNKALSWIGFLLAVMIHGAYNLTVSLMSL